MFKLVNECWTKVFLVRECPLMMSDIRVGRGVQDSPQNLMLGVIKQLRGQEKSPHFSTKGGGSLDTHVDKNLKKRHRRIMANHD